MNHAGDLVYSTKSARLHVEPHLRVKHEMARLNFLVQAYDTPEATRTGNTHTVRCLNHPHEGAIHGSCRLGRRFTRLDGRDQRSPDGHFVGSYVRNGLRTQRKHTYRIRGDAEKRKCHFRPGTRRERSGRRTCQNRQATVDSSHRPIGRNHPLPFSHG